MSNWRAALCGILVIGVAACGNGGGASGSAPLGSGAPAAAGSGAPAAPGTGASAANGKLVHVKQTKDECTFEFDAPEALKPTEKDGVSFTLEGTSFAFIGFAGSSLYGLDQLAGLATMGTKDAPVVKETANGVNLVVTRIATPSKPFNAVCGQGEEANVQDRQLGCSFLCYGVKEREADAIAMCRSVRITYTPEKGK